MEFFLDTGIVKEIELASKWGIIDGVTTNPSLIAKSGRNQIEVIREICEILDGPISAEVISTEKKEIEEEGRKLAKIHNNVVVKLPLTEAGISALKTLSSEGIKTNLTLCFSANQALLAAKCGATYISPFIGRLDDIGQNGMDLITEIKTIYSNYKIKTKILVASVRHPIHVKEAALIGADVATMPFSTMKSLFLHPLTNIGLEKFLEDHKNANK